MGAYAATHQPCDACGSSDGLAVYEDGGTFCFVCRNPTRGDGSAVTQAPTTKEWTPVHGRATTWGSRKLTQETLAACGIKMGEAWCPSTQQTAPCVVYPYFKAGQLTGQQLDFGGGEYLVLGDLTRHAELFMQHKWKPGGRQVVIIEGPKDAAAFYQITAGMIPVVSPPNGAGNAAEQCKRHLEWLESFDRVVVMFDNDDPGHEGARAVAELFTPGKAYITTTPLKDTGDMLKQDRGGEVPALIRDARPYRPSGIIAGDDLTIEALTECVPMRGFFTGVPLIDLTMRGLRKAELTTLLSGTGMGKSTLLRQMTHNLCKDPRNLTDGKPLKIGNIYLEDSQWADTAKSFVALDHKVPRDDLLIDPKLLPDASYASSLAWMKTQLSFFSHFGSLDAPELLSRMRYMAVGLGCDFIIFDHLSIAISGMVSSREGERKDIDTLLTRLRQLIANTGVGVVLVSHVKNPENGTPYEEGRQVTLDSGRGSASIKQLSDNVIGLEGNQQGPEPNLRHQRLLKQRLGGVSSRFGPTLASMEYTPSTGLMLPVASGRAASPNASSVSSDFDTEDQIPF